MLVTTKAIVIAAIKYGDSSVIVKCFTASDGIKSYLLRGILKSKKGKLKIAYFQPLTQLEIVANHKNKGSLEYIKDVKTVHPYASIHTQVTKSAIALFLSEILNYSIQEEEKNEALFEFIENALQWLDMNDEISNFHLVFLTNLTKYFGFFPETKNIHRAYFDLQEGQFFDSSTLNQCITGENLTYFKQLIGIKFDALNTIKLSSERRNELLAIFIQYFKLHLQGFRQPKSMEVLHEVFK
ncbi:DNA replication and repair protein RecO [Kordia periserrulae]|uniref:DNA repair protein RecO n=1 Tax=Kordia periserrulae TaxID=701523 RepID=A0A2T6BVY0_9FLAO|nr:DNA repair protein RecO [Kordia periserrulae]PTX60213.1 DNA replication and repair protein RecO [Kordia periserrulae]